MLKKILIGSFCFLLIIIFFVIWHYHTTTLFNPTIDILQNKHILWGKGWEKYESHYGGSAFTFSFTHSHSLSFTADSPNQEKGQGIAITIDHKLYTLSTPMHNKKLTIVFNNPHRIIQVFVKHFCAGSFSPCDVRITHIFLDRDSTFHTPPSLPATSLAIFGDSISVNENLFNFSFALSQKLNTQLHDASIFGSTITHAPPWDFALARFQKDIVTYQPTYLLIFLGTNDLGDKMPLNEFTKNYDLLLQEATQELPKTAIMTVGLLTRKDFTKEEIANYSDVIKNESEKYNVSYIDPYTWLAADNLQDIVHPNLTAQPLLADDFYQAIQQILKK